jgi:hypothetical protein
MAPGETVIIPQTINHISYYTDFFYNLPDGDFLYYLNDRLLFSDPPNEKLFDNGIRLKLLRVTYIQKKLRELIKINEKDGKPHLTVNLDDKNGMKEAAQIMGYLGLEMRKEESGQYKIMIDASAGIIDYYRFSRVDINRLERQINQTHRFYFQLKESYLQIPWSCDFLKDITGVDITPLSFFENMLKDERFSLLLSVLYRLSEQEINYINSLMSNNQAWKQIYQNKRLLVGMFVLSHALRVNNNRILLPGGDGAREFWSQLSGVNVSESPFQFIKSIATKDNGKLNYLYVFSFFLPEKNRSALFFNYDTFKMQTLYDRIELEKKAMIQTSRFPRLGDFGYFTLLYALQIKDNEIQFPGGLDSWTAAISNGSSQTWGMADTRNDPYTFITKLLDQDQQKRNKMRALQKFITLYTKFFHRPEILTKEILSKLYQMIEDYNVLVDFIEKIPLKKTETVSQLLDKAKEIEGMEKSDKILFTRIFQSLLEIFSYQAKYLSQDMDYDQLVSQLIQIPLDRSTIYNNLFEFFKSGMNIYPNKNSIDNAFIDFALKGIPNQYITMNDRKNRFLVQDQIKTTIRDILQSQEICPPSSLIEVNSVLQQAGNPQGRTGTGLKIKLIETFNQLPYPDISDEAPGFIINRVRKYRKEDLQGDLQKLINQIESKAPQTEIETTIKKIKSNYLIYQLGDYLLALSYGVNAKTERLRIFLNPNLIRLHDFDETNGDTPWNSSKTPKIKQKFSGFYFQGGLSRMNLLFSQSWEDHLFSRNYIYDQEQIQSVITNILDMYPVPLISRSQSYVGLIVELGLELIQKAKENFSINQDVEMELMTISTGYHYRKIMDFLRHKSKDYYLFFTEIFNLGERFLEKKKYLDEFSAHEKLSMLTNTHLFNTVEKEMDQFGGIYYHTFGNLTARKFHLFPQEIANLFDTNWTGGEIINEFKIKTAYHAYKKMFPPQLMGEFLYNYLFTTCRKFFSQNYIKDYFSTYFIFDILNNSHLSKIVKKLQEKGEVRLK